MPSVAKPPNGSPVGEGRAAERKKVNGRARVVVTGTLVMTARESSSGRAVVELSSQIKNLAEHVKTIGAKNAPCGLSPICKQHSV